MKHDFTTDLSMMQGLLQKQYKVVSLQWRIIGEDRAIEQYFCHDDVDKTQSFGTLQADTWLCISHAKVNKMSDWTMTKVNRVCDFHKDNWAEKKSL